MKIAFISDTHGNEKSLELVLTKVKELKADILIHLGDYANDINFLKDNFEGTVYAVAGNCDYSCDYPKENLININGKKILLTHGDLYNVKNSLNNLIYKGKSLNVDIILFGHTHIFIKEEIDDILIMNPGSIPKPSPWCKYGCIGLIDIDDLGIINSSKLYKISMD